VNIDIKPNNHSPVKHDKQDQQGKVASNETIITTFEGLSFGQVAHWIKIKVIKFLSLSYKRVVKIDYSRFKNILDFPGANMGYKLQGVTS
jgi:hypothetical protein